MRLDRHGLLIALSLALPHGLKAQDVVEDAVVAPVEPEASSPEVPAAPSPEESGVALLAAPPSGVAASDDSALELAAPTETPADASADAARPVVFEGSVGLQLLSRRFRYNEDVNDYLSAYTLGAGAGLSVDLRWFPGASFTDGVGSAFGVDVRFERSMGLRSDGDDATYDTIRRTYEILALGRYVHERLELVGQFGYGNHAFVFENDDPATNLVDPSPDVPGVTYSYLRIGGEVRAMFTERVGLLAGISYLVVLDPGGIGSSAWFPNARAGGTSLSARAVYQLPHRVELRAGLEYRRYFLDMRSELGDPYVAGGAVDHHVALEVAAAYRY